MMQQRDLTFIYRYFIAEKQESLLFLIIGIVAVILAVIFWFFIKTNPAFFKGAAIPLVAIGLIQCVVGYTVYTRSDKQQAEVAYNVGMEPVSYVKQQELPRMKTVMTNFIIYRWVELAFILTGLILIILYKTNPEKTFWYGLGITLAIQAAIMLGADYFAEKRGKSYSGNLQEILKN